MKTPYQLMLLLLFTICGNAQTSVKPTAGLSKSSDSMRTDSRNEPRKVFGPMPNPVVQVAQGISEVFRDKAGNIWLGTDRQGVCRYDGRNYAYFSNTDLRSGFSGDAVRGIAEDNLGRLWFATNNGVSRFDAKKFTHFTTREGLSHNEVRSIFKDSSGMLWLGTDAGICRFDGKTFSDFALPLNASGFPAAHSNLRAVTAIFEDASGNIWFGANGIYKYDGKTLIDLSQKSGLGNKIVQNIAQDRKGNMWFTSRFGGILKYDGKKFAAFTQANSSNDDLGWIITTDREGTVWIAKNGSLLRYDGKSFKSVLPKERFGNKKIQSLFADPKGKLWIGTSDGVFTFDGKSFTNLTRLPAADGC